MMDQAIEHAMSQLADHGVSQLENRARSARLSARECDLLFSVLRDFMSHQCESTNPFQRESESRLISAGPSPSGGFECKIQSEYVQYVAALLAGYFRQEGATNYVEMRVTHPDTGPLVLSLQRVEGQTPHELRKKAETQLSDAKNHISLLEALLQHHGIPLPMGLNDD